MKLTKKLLKGGKYLGSGSYGCVVSPFLPCKSHTQKFRTKKQNTQYVSKILKYQDEDSIHEIRISDKIKKIDPTKTYFITYETACKINTVPKHRNNTKQVEYTNNSLSYYDEINNQGRVKYSGYTKNNNKNNNKKKKCLIDLRLNPINIIMPYGGYDLFDLKHDYYNMLKNTNVSKNKQNAHFLKTYYLLKTNFKDCFKNLCIGLYKLHKNRIVNSDIKLENIMANYNVKTNKVSLRYIDFGLSRELTERYCNNNDNIVLEGTYEYLSPEIYISYVLNKYYNEKSDYSIFNIIKKKINDNVKQTYEDLSENDYINQLYKEHIDIKTKTKHDSIILKLYYEIRSHIKNKTLLHYYFGVKNVNSLDGYLQKGDVYSLGIAIYQYIEYYYKIFDIKHSKNTKLYNLIKKMIHPDHNKRYNILQCLNDTYFN